MKMYKYFNVDGASLKVSLGPGSLISFLNRRKGLEERKDVPEIPFPSQKKVLTQSILKCDFIHLISVSSKSQVDRVGMTELFVKYRIQF